MSHRTSYPLEGVWGIVEDRAIDSLVRQSTMQVLRLIDLIDEVPIGTAAVPLTVLPTNPCVEIINLLHR